MKSFYLQSDIVVETSRCTRWWTRWPMTSRISQWSRIKGWSWWLCWRWCKKSMFWRWWMALGGAGQAGAQGGGPSHQGGQQEGRNIWFDAKFTQLACLLCFSSFYRFLNQFFSYQTHWSRPLHWRLWFSEFVAEGSFYEGLQSKYMGGQYLMS